MATALENYKAYLTGIAAALPNVENQFKAADMIEQWYNARLALDALSSTTTNAYTLNGRTVTRQALPTIQSRVYQLQRDLEDILFLRSIALVDGRGYYTQGWPVAGGSVAS